MAANPAGEVASAPYEKRVALVIGNSAYRSVSELPNAHNDAKAIADALARLGFEVELKFDVNKLEADAAFARFGNKAEAAQVAALYYAGHGVQDGRKNYLVPIDARLKSDRDLKRETISLDDAIDDIRAAKIKLVFFDACRNNPFPFNRDRSVGGGLAPPSETSGTLISFATKHGTVADDGDGNHSPYTQALLAELGRAGTEVHTLLRYVSQKTKASTNGRQEPWTYGSLDGDFFLRAPAGGAQAAAVSPSEPMNAVLPRGLIEPVSDDNRHEQSSMMWMGGGLLAGVLGLGMLTMVLKSRKKAASGALGPVIDITTQWKVPENAASPAPAPSTDEFTRAPNPATIELRFWDSIKDSQSHADFGAYLAKYPHGQFAALAKNRMIQLAHRLDDAPTRLVAAAKPSPAPSKPGAALELPVENQPGTIFRASPNCPEMVIVPAGSFQMGSAETDEEHVFNEIPQHPVTIPQPFAVGRYPITFDEWDACREDGGTRHKPLDNGWGRGSRPVINLSWNDIQDYLAWIRNKTGSHYRLLSESEWEYCCRANSATTRYWGNEIGVNFANCVAYENPAKSRQTSPVGQFKPNSFGLYDMLGNVWEWVEDGYLAHYNDAPGDGKASLADGKLRVLRGGSYADVPSNVRCARRNWADPAGRRPDCGFRLALTL